MYLRGFLCLVALCASALAAPDVRVVVDKKAPLAPGSITVAGLASGNPYSLLFSVDSPGMFGPQSRVRVSLAQGGVTLVGKTLHLGDPDLYATFQPPSGAPAQVRLEVLSPMARPARFHLRVNAWPKNAAVEREPNNNWREANPIPLGSAVFASGDDLPYIPERETKPQDVVAGEGGLDWFRFEFNQDRPRLVFFQLELMERDNIPVDVSVYRVADGQAKEFNEGEDPVTLPHEVQALPGNKFTTRVLREKGTYYVRVRANHPEYKLRTRVYDVPPYSDAQQAVQTAVDYILGAGDSWHANTPRRGGVFDRVANVHQETSLCVACHPTHFSQRAQLYALRNGYSLNQKQQLQFLTERFYNNPRPFYGFEKEGAVWSRVISAAANVLSRMSVLMDMFETEVSGERREEFHRGISKYLELYYKDRDKLPAGETNGNTPLVSTYEVAWYSWRVTRDPHIAALIEQDDIRNMVDLCYQTLALADIDKVRHGEKIRRNAERILSLQRPDGRWAMRFEPNQPEVEFQTGHALWALHAAGVPREDPKVAKAIQYLLKRQQTFGGWMDPLQSYENFRTPFRETQMAVLALSAYYPKTGRKQGWDATPPPAGDVLQQLDAIWGEPAPGQLQLARSAAASNDALIRQQGVEALGRIGHLATLDLLTPALGDESKLVQRTAAWAARQIYSRRKEVSAHWLENALASNHERTRWGATRVFATHFSALARMPELAKALAARTGDPLATVRMQALKGLWQYWFWTPEESAKGLIEDTFLAAMAKPQHPWVERNLREGIYNIADENIRYLYNNWVPLLAKPEDRERAIRGRLAVERRLAHKFARTLENGSDLQRKRLLAGLTAFHLRRADIYDLKADHGKSAPAVYNRIGNDTEQVAFFGGSADEMARAILPLTKSADPELRGLAATAALMVRDVNFPGVNEVAGKPGADRKALLDEVLASGPPPEIAKGLSPPKPGAPAASAGGVRASSAGRRKLDEAFFRGYVEPILQTRGKDGYACVHCHASHTIFNGSYGSALNVVDLENPENSLLLRKPTSGPESEGVVGARTLPHGGGVRWEKGSAEYQTILDWIKGASN